MENKTQIARDTVATMLFVLGLWQMPSACVAAQKDSEARVVVLSTYLVSPARNARLEQAAKDANLSIAILAVEPLTPEELEQALQNCRMLLLDTPHISVAKSIAARLGETIIQSAPKYVVIGEFGLVAKNEATAVEPLKSEAGVPAAWAQRLREYWRFGGDENTRLAMQALQADFSEVGLPPAISMPLQGYYHPRWPKLVTDSTDVVNRLRGDPSKQNPPTNSLAANATKTASGGVVAIVVNSAVFTSDDTNWLDHMIEALEKRGMQAFAFFGPRQNANLVYDMTRNPNEPNRSIASVLINAALVFKPNERKAELDRIGIPVLQTLPSLAMNQEQWQASAEGLALSDISYYYTSSELAGMIDPLLISARDSKSGSLQPIDSQIDAVAAKAVSLFQMQHSPPADRQLAVMVYNYPQGENNFGASFLNVPKSLQNIFSALKSSGYETDTVDADSITIQLRQTLRAFYRPDSMSSLLEQDLAATFPLAKYLAWFRQLPRETQERIEAYWGPPEASSFSNRELQPSQTDDAMQFVVPRVVFGRVVVMPQPLRHPVNASVDSEKKKIRIQHKSKVPLSHQYLATYLWIRNEWHAHAVIHLGTHGTLEWSPGKERGLATLDDPYLALGDLPNIYPYIMDNLGEAITAKRRGRATILSHLTPMFSPAGFRPGLHEMHDLMHDWETVAPGPVRKEVESRLLAYFVEHQLHRDLNWTESEIASNFEGFLELLHPYLDDIAQSAQPQGLAAFGEVPSPERRFGMIMQMLRKPMIEALGEDIDEVFLLDAEKVMKSRPARWLQVALQDSVAASKLDLRKQDVLNNSSKSSVPNRAEAKVLDPDVLLSLAKRAQQLEISLSKNDELESLMAALNGQHIASSYGGDPVRNPESLPTGKNLYGFDPSRVPTRQAWDIGVAAFDAWVKEYKESHEDKWPEKIAYSLWAGETMRHQGIMEAQVLFAMGIKPTWDDSGRVNGLETLTSNDLGRPRVDVLLSVTGSYRDQFPLVMQWIDQAVQQTARLEESENFVASHTKVLEESFRSQGMSESDAKKFATVRVFSNEAGGYGTGLSDATLATDVWQNDSKQDAAQEMSQLFVQRMGHAFGTGLNGVAAGQVFAEHLKQVDAAILSRTSHTYGVLTSDDPFQYLGGLSLAIRELTGKAPSLFVQNLRDESEVSTDRASVSLAKEVNSRYLHPQWIKAQQAEGYSGTLQVLKSVQFLWGWQVTAPETIRQDQWQSFHDVYLRDRYGLGTQKWMRENNEAALAQMLERMLDAVRLDYWQPDAETRQELVRTYREAANRSNLIERNIAVTRFAEMESIKWTADAKSSDTFTQSMPESSASMEAFIPSLTKFTAEDPQSATRVSGLKLEVAPQNRLNFNLRYQWLPWGIIPLFLLMGAWRAARRIR